MLIFSYALADPVLLTIDPFLLGLSQVAVVFRHICLFAVLHVGLAVLQVGRLLRVQLSTADAIPDALLLVFFTRIYFVDPWMAGIDNARPRTGGSG